MPAADLGPDNPLPALRGERELHALDEGSNVPQEMVDSLIWGQPANILPYTRQDGYNRERRPRDFRVAVLENETLRATFLLELGGRLWSLFHKPSGRELLSVNPVFQPANLAIRNAWFSGGVEWNIGIIGHCPFTCEPLFAARVEGPDGPVLRMYEWERVRGTPFQIDAYLPDGSPVLLVRVRIINPHDHDVPMYWWSNMAVPEAADTRVIAPATEAFQFGYERLDIVPIPQSGGVDVSYPTHLEGRVRLLLPRARRSAALDHRVGPRGQRAGASLHRSAAWTQAVCLGHEAEADGVGRSSCLCPTRHTSKSRPASRARRWSICTCRPRPNGRGRRPTACWKPIRPPCTAPIGRPRGTRSKAGSNG